jgi:hypothetical protein
VSHWRSLASEFISAVEFGDKTPTWTIVSVKREQLAVLAKPGAADDAVTADDANAAKKPKAPDPNDPHEPVVQESPRVVLP